MLPCRLKQNRDLLDERDAAAARPPLMLGIKSVAIPRVKAPIS